LKKFLIVGLNQEGQVALISSVEIAELIQDRSMPYAQLHYPFENKELFERTHPADFVSEGIDQTRGWFYTLLVLSTHLFDRAPWKNLIVTGLVLAA